jgi:hypothetical protein
MTTPQPRFTDVATLSAMLGATASDATRSTLLALFLVSAETAVERYARRHFAPSPGFRTDYQRQVVGVEGGAQTNVLNVAGTFELAYGGTQVNLLLPANASQLQAALRTLPGLSAVTCGGGPLPAYPISVYMTGAPNTTPQTLLQADSTGLGSAGYVVITDCGYDSNPPVTRRYTTRGKTTNRVQDLRLVDAAPDPRIPGSGGVVLYGRRLFPNQYFLEYNGYSPGGADEAFGTGEYAEPASEIILGYGYGLGMTLAQQFAYVLPQQYLANDLQITGRWGFSPTPIDVLDATYTWAARAYREKDAAFSDTLMTPEGMTFSYFKTMPARVKQVLDTYRILNIALV